MRLGLLLLLTFAPLGCCRPLLMNSQVAMESSMQAQVRNINSLTPVVDPHRVVEKPVAGHGDCAKGPKVAILDIDGLLLYHNFTGPNSFGENPVAILREKLDAIAGDSEVCAVVLRINSPGGGVAATDLMWQELENFRKRTHLPVVACVLDLGTGGAYYIATASDCIIATPNSITGGIGVILNSYNFKKLLNYYNVEVQQVKAGEHIDIGSTAAPLRDESKDLLQAMANEYHARFQTVVRAARPSMTDEPTNFDGRVFTAQQALQRRLIDQIGYLDQAIAVARELAHQQKTRVVLFHRPTDPTHTPYDVTANMPLQATSIMHLSVPGFDRSRMPTFLYLWQPEPTMEKLGGR